MNSQLLGQRIREARENRGISQEELAQRVSKDQRTVSEMERGNRRLGATDVPIFARALGVPILYFFEGEVDKNDLDLALLKEFHELPTTEAKQAVIDLVRTVKRLIVSHS